MQEQDLTLIAGWAQLAIEAIFLEAALAVLKHGCSQLSERQGSRLEGHAFDWILNSERYIEPRLLEFSKCCSKVRTS